MGPVAILLSATVRKVKKTLTLNDCPKTMGVAPLSLLWIYISLRNRVFKYTRRDTIILSRFP